MCLGLTLSKDHPSEIWDPDMKAPGGGDANDSHAIRGEHTLVVKQVSCFVENKSVLELQ